MHSLIFKACSYKFFPVQGSSSQQPLCCLLSNCTCMSGMLTKSLRTFRLLMLCKNFPFLRSCFFLIYYTLHLRYPHFTPRVQPYTFGDKDTLFPELCTGLGQQSPRTHLCSLAIIKNLIQLIDKSPAVSNNLISQKKLNCRYELLVTSSYLPLLFSSATQCPFTHGTHRRIRISDFMFEKSPFQFQKLSPANNIYNPKIASKITFSQVNYCAMFSSTDVFSKPRSLFFQRISSTNYHIQ